MRHQIITNCMRMCDNGKYWKLKCFKSKENRTIGQWSWYDKSCCFIRTAKIEVACFIIVLCAFFSLSLSVSLFLVSFHSLCVKHFQCSAYSRDVWFFFSVHVLFTDNGTIDIVGVLFAIFVGIFFLYSQCICAHTPSFFSLLFFLFAFSVFVKFRKIRAYNQKYRNFYAKTHCQMHMISMNFHTYNIQGDKWQLMLLVI